MAKNMEREAKLGAHATFTVPDLGGDGLTVERRPDRVLTATYWDTPDLRLVRWGCSLRHRTASDGSEMGWTLKLPADPGEGDRVLRRTEHTAEGSEDAPPHELVDLVGPFVRTAALSPVARLVTRRRRIDLRDSDGILILEVADDEVSVMDGRRLAERFRELEVEVAPGEHRGEAVLPAVVARLEEAGAGAVDPISKVARALGPRAMTSPEVVSPVLPAKPTAADVALAAVADGTSRLMRHDPGARLGDDEDLHQARVATRRLRSDLRTFAAIFDQEWTAETRTELKWAAEELGAVRDADVLLSRLRKQARALSPADNKAATGLLRHLSDERNSARGRLLTALRSTRYLSLLDRLVDACSSPPFSRQAAEAGSESDGSKPEPWIGDVRASTALPDLVRRPWRHLEKAVDAAGDHPVDEALHDIRKRAKQCRYACEAASAVMGAPARRSAKAVAALQQVLGDLQDGVVAEEWLRSHALSGARADTADRAFAAGMLVAAQHLAMERSRSEWRPVWEAASDKKLRRWM